MGKVKPENEWKFKYANTGKAIKRKKRYYRNGKYYISKAAWQAQDSRPRNINAANRMLAGYAKIASGHNKKKPPHEAGASVGE